MYSVTVNRVIYLWSQGTRLSTEGALGSLSIYLLKTVYRAIQGQSTAVEKGDRMERNILIGNGINIEFGGKDKYSNYAILQRMFANIRAGKYCPLLPDCDIDQQIGLFKDFRNILVDIDHYKSLEEFALLDVEKARIKKQYSSDTELDEIGMEDYFLALEYGFREGDKDAFIHQAHRELQMLILDAIYNDGKINHIEYGAGFGDYLSSFSNVFTINYDSNLDRYRDDVKHLHGEFSKLAAEYDTTSDYSIANSEKCKASTVVAGFEHVYSNAVMSWYWLEKYGELLENESVFGVDKFKAMQGKLEIIGMSPCNDEHLFLMINHSKITSVDYYYHSEEDRTRMQQRIQKKMTFKKVDKLWAKLK